MRRSKAKRDFALATGERDCARVYNVTPTGSPIAQTGDQSTGLVSQSGSRAQADDAAAVIVGSSDDDALQLDEFGYQCTTPAPPRPAAGDNDGDASTLNLGPCFQLSDPATQPTTSSDVADAAEASTTEGPGQQQERASSVVSGTSSTGAYGSSQEGGENQADPVEDQRWMEQQSRVAQAGLTVTTTVPRIDFDDDKFDDASDATTVGEESVEFGSVTSADDDDDETTVTNADDDPPESSSDSSLASDGTASLQRALFGPSSPSLSTASTMSSSILRPPPSPTSPPPAPDSAADDDTLLDYHVKRVRSTLDAPRKYVMVTAAGDVMDAEQMKRLSGRSTRSTTARSDGTLRLQAPDQKKGSEAGPTVKTGETETAPASPVKVIGAPSQPPSPPADPTKDELLPDPTSPPSEPVTASAPPVEPNGQPAPVLAFGSDATTPLTDPTPPVSSKASSSSSSDEEKRSPRLYMTPTDQSSAADSNERIWRSIERECASPASMSEASSTTRRFANAGWLPGTRGSFCPSGQFWDTFQIILDNSEPREACYPLVAELYQADQARQAERRARVYSDAPLSRESDTLMGAFSLSEARTVIAEAQASGDWRRPVSDETRARHQTGLNNRRWRTMTRSDHGILLSFRFATTITSIASARDALITARRLEMELDKRRCLTTAEYSFIVDWVRDVAEQDVITQLTEAVADLQAATSGEEARTRAQLEREQGLPPGVRPASPTATQSRPPPDE